MNRPSGPSNDGDHAALAMAGDLARAALGYADMHQTDSVTVLVTALLLAASAETETDARLAVAVQSINDARAMLRTPRARRRAA